MINADLSELEEGLSAKGAAFIQSNSLIKDYFDGSAGRIIVKLIAGFTAFLSFKIDVMRRELSITRAQMPSSILSRAISLGYVMNRNSAPRFKFVLRPNRNISLSTAETILRINGIPLTVENSVLLNANTDREVSLIAGVWKSISGTIPNPTDFLVYQIPSEPYAVDNQLIRVFINSVPVNIVPYIEDMVDPNTVTFRTSITGGAEMVSGDGVLGKKINANDLIFIEYFETEGFYPHNNNTISPAILDAADVVSYQITHRGANYDDVEKVRSLSPRYYGTQRRAVSEEDYNAIAESGAGIISARAGIEEDDCRLIVIYLLRDNRVPFTLEELVTEAERISTISIMNRYIDCRNSVPMYVEPVIDIDVNPHYNNNSYSDRIWDIFRLQEDKLGHLLQIEDLRKAILELDGVNRVYIRSPGMDKKLPKNKYFIFRNPVINYNYVTSAINNSAVSVGNTGYLDD